VFSEKVAEEVEHMSVWEVPGVYGSAKKTEQDKDGEE
jgi:hypothetical protein